MSDINREKLEYLLGCYGLALHSCMVMDDNSASAVVSLMNGTAKKTVKSFSLSGEPHEEGLAKDAARMFGAGQHITIMRKVLHHLQYLDSIGDEFGFARYMNMLIDPNDKAKIAELLYEAYEPR